VSGKLPQKCCIPCPRFDTEIPMPSWKWAPCIRSQHE